MAGALVMLVGLLVCLAWALGIPDATRLVSASTTVRFQTGLSFLLVGASLLLVLGPRRRWALAALAPVMLLASATLLAYLFPRNVAVDWLAGTLAALAYPGPMAPNTAVGLLLATLGLAALASGHSRIWALSIAAMPASLAVALGAMAALGYALDLTVAFEWAGLTRMALVTALTLVLLGVGIIFAAREIGRAATWLEQPWFASSVGVGAAGLGLLAAHVLRAEALGLSSRALDVLYAVPIVSAALLAGAVAQARHMRLLSLQLADASRLQAEQSAEIVDLYENAPCGYHSLDAEGRFVRINRTELDWLGYGREELVGRSALRDLMTQRSRDAYEAHFSRLKAHGGERDLQLELLRKDGSILPVVLNETAVFSADGAFHHSRSTVFDDSDRRRFEQALRDGEERLRLLVDNVQAAVVVHAADSSIEYANPIAADLLGLGRERMLGRRAIDPVWRFLREDGTVMPVEEYPVSRVVREGRALHGLVAGIQVAEHEPIRWLLVDAVPAIGGDGRVGQVIVSFIDISERQRQKLDLERLASTDALTGLATRRHLIELAGHERARGRRSGARQAVIFLDLDHFKWINDRFGHDVGDQVLRRIGEILRRELRKADIAARWGGEEFCVLLPDTDAPVAVQIAERLRGAVEGTVLHAPDGSRLQITASFGVAMAHPQDESLQRAVDAADQAMYRAKREGRNRVCFAPQAGGGAASGADGDRPGTIA